MATPTSSSSPSAGPATVIDFIATAPFEIAALVFAHLDNCDLKALRLMCKTLDNIVLPHLRFERVFISASPLDVQVFNAIAEHETFRRDVREIIWDDARYEEPHPAFARFEAELDEEYTYQTEWDMYSRPYDDEDGLGPPHPPSVPTWYYLRCQDNLEDLKTRQGCDARTLPQHVEAARQVDAQMPLDVAYAHYQKLIEQQQRVLDTSADVAAFESALTRGRFPRLKKITITPAAHGVLFKPLYPTPAIRALPYGFNYRIPRGWPASKNDVPTYYDGWLAEEPKNQWRGFRHVVRFLGLHRTVAPSIEELVLDGGQIHSGLTCAIFLGPGIWTEFCDLAAVIRRPGFTSLRLNLMVCSPGGRSFGALANGRLKWMLEADLRHVTFETDEDGGLDWELPPLPDTHFVPLRSIFPVEAWGNLAHFGLCRFLVKQQDLLDFLALLPETLRSVELSFLLFMQGHGDYKDLLCHIRDDLGWKERAERPRLLIRDWPARHLSGRAVWLEDELHDFLYDEGDNPFLPPRSLLMRGPPDFPKSLVDYGFGVHRDAFEPRFERPWVSDWRLIESGVVENAEDPVWGGRKPDYLIEPW